MTAPIVQLWSGGRLPIKSGLYRADGSARSADVDPAQPGVLSLLEPIDLSSILEASPQHVTRIVVTVKQELPDGTGYLICGEGSHGSEGFFGRLDENEGLVWVVYLEHDNPFIDVTVHGVRATFTSSSEVAVTLDLDSADFGL